MCMCPHTQVAIMVSDFPHLAFYSTAEYKTYYRKSYKVPSANCSHNQEMKAVWETK